MADDLGAGQLLSNRFEILALVGRGGMSAVYEARDTLLGRIVAIKVFTVDSSADRARIESEVRLLSMLRQPTLVTVHDAYLTATPAEGPSFLVMEFVDGKSLSDVIAERNLSPGDISKIALDVGEALAAVHRAGIIHRDVKPANILIEGDEGQTGLRAKLADFGIAHMQDATRLTMPGTVIGTAAYLSPEQAEGAEVGAPSDIYSLGLVLLECFTRRREFPGTPAESLSARIARSPAIPSDLPAGWSQLLGGMLAHDPSARSTAADVVTSARLLADEDTGRAPTPVEGAADQLSTEDVPTLLLPPIANQDAPAESARRDDQVTTRFPTAERPPTSDVAKRRSRNRVLVAVIAIVAAAAIAVVILLANHSAGSLPGPGASTSTMPTTSTPSPSTTATTTPPGNGHGKGHGNGSGKHH